MRVLPPLGTISSYEMKELERMEHKACDASKRSSLVLSNPRCLISQIAVTFEGDRAGVRGETGPGRVFSFLFAALFFAVIVFDDACGADPAVPSLLSTNPFLNMSPVVYSASLPPDAIPLSFCTTSVHLTGSPLLSAFCIHVWMHHPPAFYGWGRACRRMLHAQAYACI